MSYIFGVLIGVMAAIAMATAAAAEPTCPAEDGPDAILYPNPANCSTFYQCYNGSLVEKNCPDGLHFNPVLLVCDWTWAANCTETPPIEFDFKPDGQVEQITVPPPVCPPPGTEFNETLYANLYDCSSYYTCTNGLLTEKNCPPGLHFNPLIGVCDFPLPANCHELSPAMPVRTELTFSVPKPLSSSKLDPACSPTGPPNCPPPPYTGNVTQCPNPYNCSNYYYCDNGNATLRDCPPGLEYNVAIGVCDYPWAANCVAIPPIVKLTSRANPEFVKPKLATISKRALDPACNATGPPNCPPPPATGNVTQCPNPYNCSNYYFCDNGNYTIRDCPPGLEYNAELGICDFDWAANCDALPLPIVKLASRANPEFVKPKLATISKRTLDPACSPTGPPNCPPPPATGNVTQCPNPYNCSNYYYCDNGNATLRDCPPGLEYNVAIGVCDYPWAANCVALPPPIVKLTSRANPEFVKPKLATISKRALDPACSPTGPPKCPPPPYTGNVTQCPNPYNCSNYYFCDNGNYTLRDCPSGLEYNVELGICDYPWAANCVALPPPIFKLTSRANPEFVKPKLATISKRALDPACSPTGPPKCPPPPYTGNVTQCPNPYNCSNYYFCDNGNYTLRDCPSGLEYNAELGVCDFPWAANCVAIAPPVIFEKVLSLSSPNNSLKYIAISHHARNSHRRRFNSHRVTNK